MCTHHRALPSPKTSLCVCVCFLKHCRFGSGSLCILPLLVGFGVSVCTCTTYMLMRGGLLSIAVYLLYCASLFEHIVAPALPAESRGQAVFHSTCYCNASRLSFYSFPVSPFWDRVSCSPGFPQSPYITVDDPEFTIRLPSLSGCWVYKGVPHAWC